MAKLCEDLGSPKFSESVLGQARAAQQPKALQAEVAAIDGRLSPLNQQIARVAHLIAETATPRPLIAKLEELERERLALSAKHAGLKAEHDAAKDVTLLTPQIVRGLLQDIVANIRSYPREQLKDFLRSVVSKISLSKTRKGAVSACLDYEIPAFAGDKVTSSRDVKRKDWRGSASSLPANPRPFRQPFSDMPARPRPPASARSGACIEGVK